MCDIDNSLLLPLPCQIVQEPHAKQVKELLAAQESAERERTRLEAQQLQLQGKRADLNAQVQVHH